MKVRTKGLLFDMDGVLISSLGSVERSWQTWAESHGLDVRETIKTAHGMRAIETVRKLKPDADHTAELKVIEDLEIEDKDGLEVLEGVTSILQSVPQKFWTIVTSATERLARSRLAFAGVAASAIAALAVGVVAYIFARPIIVLIYGAQFATADMPFRILCLGLTFVFAIWVVLIDRSVWRSSVVEFEPTATG